jgi:hypothetical protein
VEWQSHRGVRCVAVVGALVIVVAVPLLGGVASASTRAVPQAMVGCWHRHVPAVTGLTSAGVWLMKITSRGKLAAYTPGTTSCGSEPDFTATVSVAANHLTIGSVPVCATKGVYSWKAAAKTLMLQATADKSCSPRTVLFTGVWRRA